MRPTLIFLDARAGISGRVVVGTMHALGPNMHTLLFSLRRADLRSIEQQKAWLKDFGITPARYQMLLVIANSGHDFAGETKWLFQSEIREALGVSRMTVSVMVRALLALGLVVRTRQLWDDKRQLLVKLTPKAWELLAAISAALIDTKVVRNAIYKALDPTGRKVGTLMYWTDRFRQKFFDTADFLYPWKSIDEDRESDPIPERQDHAA